jgi:nitrogen fixation-related uncharacterized protein
VRVLLWWALRNGQTSKVLWGVNVSVQYDDL